MAYLRTSINKRPFPFYQLEGSPSFFSFFSPTSLLCLFPPRTKCCKIFISMVVVADCVLVHWIWSLTSATFSFLFLEQVNWALNNGRFVVHPGWWVSHNLHFCLSLSFFSSWILTCAASFPLPYKNRVEASALLYRRANEQDFAIKP